MTEQSKDPNKPEQNQGLLAVQIKNEESLNLTINEITSSIDLARILERVHKRLIQEGYTVELGKIYKK